MNKMALVLYMSMVGASFLACAHAANTPDPKVVTISLANSCYLATFESNHLGRFSPSTIKGISTKVPCDKPAEILTVRKIIRASKEAKQCRYLVDKRVGSGHGYGFSQEPNMLFALIAPCPSDTK